MRMEAVETEEVLLEALLEEPSSLNFNAFSLVVSWAKTRASSSCLGGAGVGGRAVSHQGCAGATVQQLSIERHL
jgi:hypothetical protein